MRNLGAVVGILLGIVGNAWQDRSTGSGIALQLVGDDPEWLLALTAQQSTKEPLGCTLITSRLQQNINDITILIHGTPKILLLAVDSDEEFVQIPSITEASLFLLKTSGIVGSEFPAPLANGFVRNNYSAFGQKIFHITEAQTEAMIDPYGIAEISGGKRCPAVTGSGAVHEMSLSVGCPS